MTQTNAQSCDILFSGTGYFTEIMLGDIAGDGATNNDGAARI